MEKGSNIGLTANQLKIIAIIAMLIDHIAWAFVPTESVQGQLLHVIGRLTAPIMSYFIVEGFFHTRNCKKYFMRMFIFAIISYFAYQFYDYGQFFYGFKVGNPAIIAVNSVIYTLMLGLLTLIIWYKTAWKKGIKVILVILICIIAIPGDWLFITVLWIFFMGLNYGNFKKQMKAFLIIGFIDALLCTLISLSNSYEYWWSNLFQFGIVLAVLLLSKYNGELGKSKNMKWIFYIFYPLHLFILGLIRFYIV